MRKPAIGGAARTLAAKWPLAKPAGWDRLRARFTEASSEAQPEPRLHRMLPVSSVRHAVPGAIFVAVFAAVLALGTLPLRAQSAEVMARQLAEAVSAARGRDWSRADALVAGLPDTAAREVVTWLRLRAGEGSIDDFANFLSRNAHWPSMSQIARAGEDVAAARGSDAQVIAYFAVDPPRGGVATVRLVEALVAAGRRDEARGLAIEAWRSIPLQAPQQQALLSRFGGDLAPHHSHRLDWLLWSGLTDEAERMLPLVSADVAALGRARIDLRRDAQGVDARVAAVPERLRDHPGLAYERFLWRDRRGRGEAALELLRAHSVSAEALGEPARWAPRRRAFARAALRAGDGRAAYEIAARHFLEPEEGFNFADLEWLAGYVALTLMGEPTRAIPHFEAVRDAVNTAISLGRAHYWLGRAHEAAGNAAAARAAYAAGAEHQTSFYGQLAAERAGLPADPALTGLDGADWRGASFMDSPLMRAALLLYLGGEKVHALRFLEHVADGLDSTGIAQLGGFLLELDEPFLALRVAKRAAARGIVVAGPAYPLNGAASLSLPVPAELALSVTRQESEFNPVVRSPAGALGLMQLMPATARAMAAATGEAFSEARLLSDWEYNTRLGAAYLAERLEDYGGSLILTLAAYNAGPARVRAWLADNGDPRRGEIDPVDWIERIPFAETRNYVMRTMEALMVYRARLSGQAGPLTLSRDLGRR